MDLLAAGVYDLGLTAAEFSSFTPRHIDAFYKRHLAAETRRMQLTLWYANVHRDTDKKPDQFTIDDFVPGATASLSQVTVRAVERMPGESVEDFLNRVSRPTINPQAQIESIKAQARGFGKWRVENA